MNYTLITILSLIFILLSGCQKEKLPEKTAFVIFSNSGKTITPLRIYINDRYVGQVTEQKKVFDCTEEYGTLKVQLVPGVKHNLKVYLSGQKFLDEDFAAHPNYCMIWELE